MGSSSNSNTNSSNQQNSTTAGTSTMAPSWAPQVNALTTAFNQAGGALTNAQSAMAPTGTMAALLGNGTLSNNGVNLSNSGANASSAALSKLLGYDPTTLNNPQTLIDQANQYVAGQNIPAQVRAAMQGGMETARDVTLPGIAQNAATSGNTDSSRNGIAQGLVERGLAEQSANLQNSLAGQAYGTGLQLASNNANANNQGKLVADNAAAGQGTNAANTGSNVYSGSLNNTGMANNINQGNYSNDVNNAYAALQQYMNLIGNRNWGMTTNTNGTVQSSGTSTQNTQTQNNPGLLSNISTGIGLLGAFL
jgi:hypothetical protein